jgi:hypothetical protein
MRPKLPGGKKAEQLRAMRKKQFEKHQQRKHRRAERNKRTAERDLPHLPSVLALKPSPQPKEPTLFDPWIPANTASAHPQPKAKTNFKAKTKTKTKAKVKANLGATTEATSTAAIAMPPRMAKRTQAEAARIDQIVQCPTRARKEIARLNALISKLTAQPDKVAPKALYFDENWLAARWGMSVKHIRNLRAAGVGPLVTYFGRSVRYRLRDVLAFEKANKFASRTAKEQDEKGDQDEAD